MNDLELQVQPLFEKFFTGILAISDMTLHDQSVIQKWAFKTALAVIAAWPLENLSPPLEHYRQMAATQDLPEGIHVIGSHVGGEVHRFGICILGRLSVVAESESPDLDGSYIVIIHFANTVLAVTYCSSTEYLVGLDRLVHWPIGRPLSEYFWYEPVEFQPKQFEDEREMWEDLARTILFLPRKQSYLKLTLADGSIIRSAGIPDQAAKRKPIPID